MHFTSTANSPEGHDETELEKFFAGLGQKINNAVKNYEAELASFFGGLGPVGDIAIRVQAAVDRTATTKFSIFEYFKVPEEVLSDIFADLLKLQRRPQARQARGHQS